MPVFRFIWKELVERRRLKSGERVTMVHGLVSDRKKVTLPYEGKRRVRYVRVQVVQVQA